MPIRWVFFDVGETLVDETRAWTSWAEWLGVPALTFFERLASKAGVAPADAAYVGDRVDNDVVPAASAGMLSVFLRRGPWAIVQSTWPEAARADVRIDTLADLADALARQGGPGMAS